VVGVTNGTEIVRRPGRRSTLLVALAGGVAAAASVVGGTSAAVIALVGAILLVGGTAYTSQTVVDVGGLVAFVGVCLAGLGDGSPLGVVIGVAAAIAGWDVGTNAISLGRQLGQGADTLRVEGLHALVGVTVGVTAGLFGFVLFEVGPTGQPVTTLFVLLVGAVLLIVALNR
jgi:hypothetical protein